MRLFDTLFGTAADSDGRIRNQTLPMRNSIPNDKEVITVDPGDPLPDSSNRPPIIFENGLK